MKHQLEPIHTITTLVVYDISLPDHTIIITITMMMMMIMIIIINFITVLITFSTNIAFAQWSVTFSANVVDVVLNKSMNEPLEIA